MSFQFFPRVLSLIFNQFYVNCALFVRIFQYLGKWSKLIVFHLNRLLRNALFVKANHFSIGITFPFLYLSKRVTCVWIEWHFLLFYVGNVETFLSVSFAYRCPFECSVSIFWFHPAFYDVWTLARTKKEEIQPQNFLCSSMFILHSFIVTCCMTNALKLTGQNKQIAKHAFISSVAFSIVNDTTQNPWWLVLPAQFVGLLRKKIWKRQWN